MLFAHTVKKGFNFTKEPGANKQGIGKKTSVDVYLMITNFTINIFYKKGIDILLSMFI